MHTDNNKLAKDVRLNIYFNSNSSGYGSTKVCGLLVYLMNRLR